MQEYDQLSEKWGFGMQLGAAMGECLQGEGCGPAEIDGYWKSSIGNLMTKENFACVSFFIPIGGIARYDQVHGGVVEMRWSGRGVVEMWCSGVVVEC